MAYEVFFLFAGNKEHIAQGAYYKFKEEERSHDLWKASGQLPVIAKHKTEYPGTGKCQYDEWKETAEE